MVRAVTDKGLVGNTPAEIMVNAKQPSPLLPSFENTASRWARFGSVFAQTHGPRMHCGDLIAGGWRMVRLWNR